MFCIIFKYFLKNKNKILSTFGLFKIFKKCIFLQIFKKFEKKISRFDRNMCKNTLQKKFKMLLRKFTTLFIKFTSGR